MGIHTLLENRHMFPIRHTSPSVEPFRTGSMVLRLQRAVNGWSGGPLTVGEAATNPDATMSPTISHELCVSTEVCSERAPPGPGPGRSRGDRRLQRAWRALLWQEKAYLSQRQPPPNAFVPCTFACTDVSSAVASESDTGRRTSCLWAGSHRTRTPGPRLEARQSSNNSGKIAGLAPAWLPLRACSVFALTHRPFP